MSPAVGYEVENAVPNCRLIGVSYVAKVAVSCSLLKLKIKLLKITRLEQWLKQMTTTFMVDVLRPVLSAKLFVFFLCCLMLKKGIISAGCL
jgi:hypothetical protein